MANKLGQNRIKGQGLGVTFTNNRPQRGIINGIRDTNSSRSSLLDNRLPGNLENAIPIGNPLNKEPEKDPYMELYEAYASRMEGMSASQKAALEAKYKEAYGLLNKNYDRNANYAYINYKQGQKQLPEELSNLGVTGGASESAVAKLQNAYGQNLSQNEYERNNQLASARSNYNEALNGVDTNLNAQLADAYANFAQQSLAYKQTQKEKADAKAAQAKVDSWNSGVMANIAKRQREGKDVTTWTDSDGKLHYQVVNNATKKQSELDKWNNSVQSNIAKRQREGYDVYTWTDGSGKLHYRLLGKKKLSSGSGSGRKSGGSRNYSGGGGSNSPSAVPNNGGGGSNKPKPIINYSQATSYFNQNIAKILGDPNSVVEDLNKKMKSGEMNEITADYIMTKFPRKKSKGKRKKKG